ncbi:MAG: shikimate kinase [Acidobacteriota bacterium]
MTNDIRIALTGFMGVGKSSVARHLSMMLGCKRLDLDALIEAGERKKIAQIIDGGTIEDFREIETRNLKKALAESNFRILSLGGGTWTIPENRELIKKHGIVTVWLETSFDHCWFNIVHSKKERPLARNKRIASKLFNERQELYCLADWHFIVKPESTSYDVAKQINEEIFNADK